MGWISDYSLELSTIRGQVSMYFLRARYNNVQTGRFHSMDTYEGRNGEPMTLHKYLYAHANPVSYVDPSGNFSLIDLAGGIGLSLSLGRIDLNNSLMFVNAVGENFMNIGVNYAKQYLRLRGYHTYDGIASITINSFLKQQGLGMESISYLALLAKRSLAFVAAGYGLKRSSEIILRFRINSMLYKLIGVESLLVKLALSSAGVSPADILAFASDRAESLIIVNTVLNESIDSLTKLEKVVDPNGVLGLSNVIFMLADMLFLIKH
ncbi:MAG: RHS repeat-associated core domain-containing protein [Bacteroidota bacterium]